MGILQGDSPTPGPAMYWQPYHTEETALRVRPMADDLPSCHNNNNNVDTDESIKMIQQHNTDQVTSFYSSNSEVKEERSIANHEEPVDVCQETASNRGEPVQQQPAVCAGCSFKIADRYYLVAVDKAWHSDCLRCDECRRPLDTALSCFARQSRIYCRDDYHRLFGGRKQCAKCCETLQPDELVMRGRDHLFHTRCFSCHVCQTHLIKGSTFGMVGALIFCQQHYQQQHQEVQPVHLNPINQQQQHQSYGQQSDVYMTPHVHPESFGSPHPFGDHPVHSYGQTLAQPDSMELGKPYGSPVSVSPAEPLKHQRVRTKRRPSTKSDMMAIMNEREDDSYMSMDGVGMLDTSSSSPSSMLTGCVMGQQPIGQQQQHHQQQQPKTKRLRTSFKHHQLRMLKSYFATNHNPDAKDLKQLSQKTTLSKRVLQVWFQNARAKWRRLVQKTEGGQNSAGHNIGNTASGHNLSSSSSNSSNCSGSGNETGSPVPSSSASPSHARHITGHHPHQQPMMMMTNFIDHHHQHQQQQQQQHHLMSSHSRMSLYDEISLSGSSSVASVGFPSPI